MTSTASRSETDEEKWFFGKISSSEAANYLNNAGGEEGTFLVRESCSSPGNFVLSFISENRPVDLLICSYWQDAFYSLITHPQNIFHGLDTLIANYCQHPINGPGRTVLSYPCVGETPPPETRLHGSSNLLHRAVNQANIKVVSELLKSGYRKIDAKNNFGQTALHIACIKGKEEIVRLLLKANANVNVRDQEGLTPLQHACRQDYPSIVHLLVSEGKANIQLRTPVTGEVALHEAASCGSLGCVKTLLTLHAPAWPRCSKNNTPAMMAKLNKNSECFALLVNHRPTIPLVRLPEYYQGKISRGEAQRILMEQEADGGFFLLRRNSKKENCFVLSVKENRQVYHFQIQKKRSMYFIDDGPYFKCLETLLDHYSRFWDGLPCRLTNPVPPNEPLEDREFRAIYSEDEKCAREGRSNTPDLDLLLTSEDVPDNNFNLLYLEGNLSTERLISKSSSENLLLPSTTVSIDALSVSPSTSLLPSPLPSSPPSTVEHLSILASPHPQGSSPRPHRHSPHTMTIKGNKTQEVFGSIDASSLSVGDVLGVGEFGTVHKGIWISPSGDQIEVAVKTLHDNDSLTKENFLREAKVMINLNHPYIVKLLGVCQGPPVAMVQELAVMGSLLNFLLDFPDQIDDDFHFKLWAAQVADGMNYLEKKHFVHRDLAARNLLLSSVSLVKISDFGLSRALGANNDYYKATEGGRWPLKWYAPESIYYGQFTHLSDVWSYGVTLWEMYTFGDQPYGELTGHEVATLLEKGERLPQPKNCPIGAFNIMLQCWNALPKLRPTFNDLVIKFKASRDYVNIKPYFRDT